MRSASESDRFIADLLEESYLHFAGHKETFELEAIYARYEELSRLETVAAARRRPRPSSGASRARASSGT